MKNVREENARSVKERNVRNVKEKNVKSERERKERNVNEGKERKEKSVKNENAKSEDVMLISPLVGLIMKIVMIVLQVTDLEIIALLRVCLLVTVVRL